MSRGRQDDTVRRNFRSEQTLGNVSGGDATDRSRFIIDRLIPGDEDRRSEIYVQIVVSRKAAAIIVLFLTFVVSCVEVFTRWCFGV